MNKLNIQHDVNAENGEDFCVKSGLQNINDVCVCVSTLIGSSSRHEHRKLAKQEMSHIMATF